MTVMGIGLDLIDLDHFGTHYGEEDPDLLARCFTNEELRDAGQGANRLPTLAGRFALKEAVFKALGGGKQIALTDVETLRTAGGTLNVRLHGPAAVLAADQGIGVVLVSVSHSASAAAAVAVALSVGPR